MSGYDLYNMSSLSWISLMSSLNILCFNPLTLKNKIMNIEYKKIVSGPAKSLKNFSWLINIHLKHFKTPPKIHLPPSYIPNEWSLIWKCWRILMLLECLTTYWYQCKDTAKAINKEKNTSTCFLDFSFKLSLIWKFLCSTLWC